MNDMNEWRRRAPHPFPPPWASAWGDDRFGLWAEFAVGEDAAVVTQRMRWVEPGEFDMGAGEDEDGDKNEYPQHRVTISSGLWLADTACTQALWKVVEGERKSGFYDGGKDKLTYPAKNVSWKDVQVFLGALEQLLAGNGKATLPTEAEWEYACRAGTHGPFSFGATITRQQANFNENYPSGEPSDGIKKIVAVKDLPANAWGLYQMHGNVWEWCANKFYTYRANQKPTDPLEDVGANRMLRGGCCYLNAKQARSAQRLSCGPAGHIVDAGFRFALRSGS